MQGLSILNRSNALICSNFIITYGEAPDNQVCDGPLTAGNIALHWFKDIDYLWIEHSKHVKLKMGVISICRGTRVHHISHPLSCL